MAFARMWESKKADESLKTALKAAPDNAAANFVQKDDMKDGTKTLEDLIEKQPAYADVYLLLGTIYQKQSKISEAEKVYNKALENEGIPGHIKPSSLQNWTGWNSEKMMLGNCLPLIIDQQDWRWK